MTASPAIRHGHWLPGRNASRPGRQSLQKPSTLCLASGHPFLVGGAVAVLLAAAVLATLLPRGRPPAGAATDLADRTPAAGGVSWRPPRRFAGSARARVPPSIRPSPPGFLPRAHAPAGSDTAITALFRSSQTLVDRPRARSTPVSVPDGKPAMTVAYGGRSVHLQPRYAVGSGKNAHTFVFQDDARRLFMECRLSLLSRSEEVGLDPGTERSDPTRRASAVCAQQDASAIPLPAP